MLKKIRLKLALSLLIVAISLNSCYEEIFNAELGDIKWTSEWAVPIINTTFTMEDVILNIDSTGLIQEIDGAVSIVYGFDLPSQFGGQLFELNPQAIDFSFPLPPDNINEFNTTGSTSVSLSFNFPFGTNAELLDSLWLAGGNLLVSIDENFPADGDIQLNMPGIRQRQTSETISSGLSWVYDPLNPGNFVDDNFNLANHAMNLTYIDGNNDTINNEFTVDFTVNLTRNDEFPSNIDFTDEIRLRLDMQSLQFEGMFGEFGNRALETDENEIDLSFFEQIADFDGVFELDNPRVIFNFNNSFGVPLNLDFSGLTFVMRDGSRQSLQYTGNSVLAAPGMDEVGSSVETVIEMNNTNSNFEELFSQLPTRLEYNLLGELNSGVQSDRNFVLNTSAFDLSLETQIPLAGRFSGLTIDERIAFDGEGFDEVLEASLIIKANNGLPLNVDLRADLLTENDEFLASLTQGDQQSLLVAESESSIEIRLDEDAMRELPNAKRIRLLMTISTKDWETGETIVLSSSDQIELRVGVTAKVQVTASTSEE